MDIYLFRATRPNASAISPNKQDGRASPNCDRPIESIAHTAHIAKCPFIYRKALSPRYHPKELNAPNVITRQKEVSIIRMRGGLPHTHNYDHLPLRISIQVYSRLGTLTEVVVWSGAEGEGRHGFRITVAAGIAASLDLYWNADSSGGKSCIVADLWEEMSAP